MYFRKPLGEMHTKIHFLDHKEGGNMTGYTNVHVYMRNDRVMCLDLSLRHLVM